MAILSQHCTGPWQDPTCGAWECPWDREVEERDLDEACEACARKDIE